ncbi:MAG TPA: NAD-dependent epimerase/dehydratase family protein [Tahibacter sp.]|uniref:SDR family oxidoreductase n=1 Tax=Tahibacter sp. TaxID=2056211 RepID=UPI002BDC7BEE|nr:NAD-dependent epimerase/dehydratase family protein [Tahibacter sp.]HSX61984.1 NAD-dependent epimerase/dehydratase family protein [Tahibacter sp.]
MTSTAFVIGGSGAVGRFLLPRLAATGTAIVALSRKECAPRDGVTWLRGGLDTSVVAPPVDAIVCVGPLDHCVAWLEASPTPAPRRVVALSSMSADSKRESLDAAERALAARLADAEQRLMAYASRHTIPATVLRPTLIYGAGVDRSLTPIAQFARRARVFPLIRGAHGLRQPVHADDVAAACVAALSDAAAGQVLPLGGGERLSFAQMLARVREGLGRRTIPLPLDINLLRLASRVTGRGSGMLQRLTHDLVADNAPLVERLGISPRAFRPGPDCWQPSAS